LRDILTVIAGLLVLALAAALVAPPLIDWEARRELIDNALSEAAGTSVKTDGRIEVRFLPSPRVRIDDLRLGSGRPEDPALAAHFVKAEMALTPLLRGQVRFTDTRIGRAEIRVPTAGDGSWRLPPDIVSGQVFRRDWAFEDLRIAQLLVTTVTPTTGRTDQFYAETVRIEGQSLAGPWRVDGMTAGVPFRLATSELAVDRTIQVRLAGGGDIHPRFDIDAKIELGSGDVAGAPGVSGNAKILFGPPAQIAAAGIPIPVVLQTSFKTAGHSVELDPLSIEAGEGGASLRLGGTGSVRTDEPRIALKLEGKRLDVDSFILSASGQEFKARSGRWSPPPTSIPIDVDLSLASIGLAQEELTNFVLRASLLKGRAQVERLELMAPGQSRFAMQGEVGLTREWDATGRVALASGSTDRLLRYLAKLDLAPPFAAAAEGQSLEVAADVNFAPPVASFRNLRMKLGEAALTGAARYTAPEAQARGKLEAQIGVQGLDLNQLPQLGSVFEATRDLDVGFVLDARGVRHGGREGAGRISARILSDGPALFVETLDIVDLAGANARVSGRIAPDGSGRIAGRVTARRAAPLVDLLGSVWVGGVSRLVPYFLREGDLDLEVTAERAGPDPRSSAPRLRTTARGRAAGGLFEADVLSIDGATDNLTVRLATENTGVWVDKANVPVLRRPSSIELKGVRVPSGQFNMTAAGEIGGVKVSTTRPFALGSGDDVVDSGEADLATADVTPFLVLLGDGAGVDPPVPAQVRVTLGRERDASLLMVGGKIADGAVQARLAARSRADITGSVSLEKLSLPWLVTSFALNTAREPRPNPLWSTARFGQSGKLVSGGQVSFKVGQLELGRGYRGENAEFDFSITPEGVVIREFGAGFAQGRLHGGFTITRQGALASLIGEATLQNASLPALLAPSPFAGKLSGALRFGSSGETPAALITNLSGGGDLRFTDLQIPNADPGAIDRTTPRMLAESDPLSSQRLAAILTEELNRGPLRAGSVGAPATMVGGVLRVSPLSLDAGAAAWQGTLAADFKSLTFEARGTLASKTSPKGWTGSPPSIGLGWRGAVAAPAREIDPGPLANGLAAIVLQRELDKIEAFQMDANERARLNGRREMDRARERDRLAAEEAAQQARLQEQRAREEAARLAKAQEEAERLVRIREQQEAERQARLREEALRQARIREQQEAERQARLREEAQRQARIREQQEAEHRARLLEQAERARAAEESPVRPPPLSPALTPLDIRPPAVSRPPG
jgi:uncharacterized protein involved in outer membrane biogenesis